MCEELNLAGTIEENVVIYIMYIISIQTGQREAP